MVKSLSFLLFLVAVWATDMVRNRYTDCIIDTLYGSNGNYTVKGVKESKFCGLESSFFESSEIKDFLRTLEVNFNADFLNLTVPASVEEEEEYDCTPSAECNEYRKERLEFGELYEEKLEELQLYAYGLANMYSLGAVCLGAAGGYVGESSKVLIKKNIVDRIQGICENIVESIGSYSSEFGDALNFGKEHNSGIQQFEASHEDDFNPEKVCKKVIDSLDLKQNNGLMMDILKHFEDSLYQYHLFLDYHECLMFSTDNQASCDEKMVGQENNEGGEPGGDDNTGDDGNTEVVSSREGSGDDGDTGNGEVADGSFYVQSEDGFDILYHSFNNPEYISMVANYIPDDLGRDLSDSVIIAIATFSIIILCIIIGLIVGLVGRKKRKNEEKRMRTRGYNRKR